MYICRPPDIKTTPFQLAQACGWKTIKGTGRLTSRLKWGRDFFMYYPHLARTDYTSLTINELEAYKSCYTFQSKDKINQLITISELGFRTTYDYEPRNDEDQYRVFRPLRHSGGENFWVVRDDDIAYDDDDRVDARHFTSDLRELVESLEYYTVPFFHKTREYRVILMRGVPIILLRKVMPGTPDPLLPWNHANGARFETLSLAEGSKARLFRSNFFSDLSNALRENSFLQHLNIVGIDVMMNSQDEYVVSEFNLCPGITIETNLHKVKENVLLHSPNL